MSTGYSQLFWKFILLIFLITQVVQTVASLNKVKFTCDASGNINTITKEQTDPTKILIKISDNTYCHYSEPSCKTDNVHQASTLHIIIQADENPKLYAGKTNLHYLIECTNEFDVVGSALPFNISPSTTMKPTPVTVASPVLSLKILSGALEMQANAEVYIGEHLQLQMSSTGNTVYPQSCTAIDGEHSSIEVPIWTYNPHSSDDHCSTYDSAITDEKWTLQKSDNKTLNIPIYAFQFTTSSKVVIKCSAHVCTLSPGNCSPISSKTCVNDVARRRKRRSSGIVEEEKTEVAHVSFSVKSENKVHSKANALSVHLTLVVAFVVFGRRMVAFLRED